MNFSGCARLVELARNVDADPASIGVLSTGEACAVALLLGRLDRLNDSYKYPLDALRGSSRSGKRRCVIFTAPDGGNDRARPQKIEQKGQERISRLAARNGRALRSGR